ncbi:MAG: hypothetical protein U5P10_15075 [Spirochaetia bacterium]|nr:hypothetical protein [Spirochaetia bacterium]
MSMVYIHEGTPMEGSEQADVTLYHLSEKRPDFIISIYGFLPKLKDPLEQLESHYVEIIDKRLTHLTWENAQGAIEQPEDNEFEYVKVEKATSAIKRLFITTLFHPEVELVK